MPFADEMINAETGITLAEILESVRSDADLSVLRAATQHMSELSLRERADALRDGILVGIPGEYDVLAQTIRDARAASSEFSGWLIWPVTTAVAERAVAAEHTASFLDGLDLLAELTGLLTAEFAIRTLLRADLETALPRVLQWTQSADEHVRRLASEGTRPYLPWAVRVPEIGGNPGVTVPILDALYRDPSEYVRRSVANHLNDLSRDHADLVTETAARWLAAPDAHTEWVVRHGLRTLVKRGDSSALALLGFADPIGAIDIGAVRLDRASIVMGESIEFSGTVRNTSDEAIRLAIDYVVHHFKASGSQTAKTFKLSTVVLQPGETHQIRRSHSFRPISTRRYYPGPHAIGLQINGVSTETAVFELTV